ncbi:unnamed protein product, partial [Vitis vinifera]
MKSIDTAQIDSGDNLDQNSDIVFAETSSERDQRAEEADEDYPPSLQEVIEDETNFFNFQGSSNS